LGSHPVESALGAAARANADVRVRGLHQPLSPIRFLPLQMTSEQVTIQRKERHLVARSCRPSGCSSYAWSKFSPFSHRRRYSFSMGRIRISPELHIASLFGGATRGQGSGVFRSARYVCETQGRVDRQLPADRSRILTAYAVSSATRGRAEATKCPHRASAHLCILPSGLHTHGTP
jgi:hypothetical protein